MNQLSLMPIRVRIASELRKAIYAGEYKSGDELSLTDVAAQLGVSRTPVREAFQELESEGLITLRMNRGAVVNTIDRKFVRDIFEIRRLLEADAVERAAKNGMETECLLERLYDLRDHITEVSRSSYEMLNQDIFYPAFCLIRCADRFVGVLVIITARGSHAGHTEHQHGQQHPTVNRYYMIHSLFFCITYLLT